MSENKNSYNASSIEILDGLEHVRKRPGMYIGSTDTYGLHHLVWEIVDNSIDEALNGFGNKITIILHKDNSVTVSDEGRGIPCDMHKVAHIPAIQLILTTLNSGGKFGSNSYKTSGGLHGVGSSVTNALSSYMDVTVFRDGNIYFIAFENGGKLKTPLKILGKTSKHGTVTTFKPDNTIFKNNEFSYEKIYNHIHESSYLLKGVHFYLVDERSGQKDHFYYENGIREYLNEVSLNKKEFGTIIYFNDLSDNIFTEIAFKYFLNEYSENIKSYVNNIRTIDGGTHEIGFKLGLTRAVNDYIDNNNLGKSKAKLEGADIREGITAIISCRIPGDILELEGQTKSKLGTTVVQNLINNFVYTKFTYYLNENKDFAVNLIKKCQDSQAARLAARKAKEEARTGKLKSKNQILLSDKLTPAQSKNYKINELFIVEGDSAGGTAKRARDPYYQAILPLRGKPLNTDGLPIQKILANQEFATLINTIGAGVGDNFDIDDIHYDKVIIMTDADTDGAHIQTLLLTFFYNNMKPLITEGHLFVAVPPLYRVHKNGTKGLIEKYCYDEGDLEEAKKEIGKGYTINRYKGLGEMNPIQLKSTTMDKEKRRLLKVCINDSLVCACKINTLMGDDPEKRRIWIEKNVDFNEKDSFILEIKR